MLEIARQSVPDGYGNSYFWVKPDRIVPRDLVTGGRRPARLHRRRGAALRRGRRPRGGPLVPRPRHRHPRRLLPALLRQPRPRGADARGPRRGAPRRGGVASRSEVLREYREYERAMTTLVDAAVKPRLSAYVDEHQGPARGVRRTTAPSVPFYVMKSNGGVLSADEVVHQPITTVLSGPAAGALGAALIAKVAGFDRVLTCDGGGTSTDVSRGHRRRADADHRGLGRRLPEQDPDDRRGHRRRRAAARSPGCRPRARSRSGRSRRAPTPGRSATARAAPRSRSPTPTWCSAGSRRTCSAARSRSTSTRPAPASSGWPRELGLTPGGLRRPASWRSPPGTRPTRCARSPSSAASTSATSR